MLFYSGFENHKCAASVREDQSKSGVRKAFLEDFLNSCKSGSLVAGLYSLICKCSSWRNTVCFMDVLDKDVFL